MMPPPVLMSPEGILIDTGGTECCCAPPPIIEGCLDFNDTGWTTCLPSAVTSFSVTTTYDCTGNPFGIVHTHQWTMTTPLQLAHPGFGGPGWRVPALPDCFNMGQGTVDGEQRVLCGCSGPNQCSDFWGLGNFWSFGAGMTCDVTPPPHHWRAFGGLTEVPAGITIRQYTDPMVCPTSAPWQSDGPSVIPPGCVDFQQSFSIAIT